MIAASKAVRSGNHEPVVHHVGFVIVPDGHAKDHVQVVSITLRILLPENERRESHALVPCTGKPIFHVIEYKQHSGPSRKAGAKGYPPKVDQQTIGTTHNI